MRHDRDPWSSRTDNDIVIAITIAEGTQHPAERLSCRRHEPQRVPEVVGQTVTNSLPYTLSANKDPQSADFSAISQAVYVRKCRNPCWLQPRPVLDVFLHRWPA
jgi:hypothetical protein